MTKKDYVKIAKIIYDNEVGIVGTHDLYLRKDNLIQDLVLYFEDDNPKFDRDTFKEACNDYKLG